MRSSSPTGGPRACSPRSARSAPGWAPWRRCARSAGGDRAAPTVVGGDCSADGVASGTAGGAAGVGRDAKKDEKKLKKEGVGGRSPQGDHGAARPRRVRLGPLNERQPLQTPTTS